MLSKVLTFKTPSSTVARKLNVAKFSSRRGITATVRKSLPVTAIGSNRRPFSNNVVGGAPVITGSGFSWLWAVAATSIGSAVLFSSNDETGSDPRVSASTTFRQTLPVWQVPTVSNFMAKFASFAAEKLPIYGIPGGNKERSFIAVKPDGVHRGYVGEIISRFEEKGYKLVAIKVTVPSKEFAEKHYSDLAKKPFFGSLCAYFSSGPVVAMVWEGKDVISGGRSLIGATNPQQATPGTIRGDYAITIGRNMVHGSDSAESAKNEISLWFTEKDIADFDHALDKWVHEK